MKIAVYTYSTSGRSRLIADSMHEGALRYGFQSEICGRFKGVVADVAVAYGWVSEEVFKAYKNYVYIDLGYWQREQRTGYHRLAINSWDTATHMLRGCSSDRFDQLGISVNESVDVSRRNTALIIGMSEKGANTHGHKPNVWEYSTRDIVTRLCPEFEVAIRPKPNKRMPALRPLDDDLTRARVVLMHHSNVALEAAAAGIPAHAVKGVGALLSTGMLTAERLRAMRCTSIAERRALLYDAAYAQWNTAEMSSGQAWEYVEKCLDSVCT